MKLKDQRERKKNSTRDPFRVRQLTEVLFHLGHP
jgi:hypothetical protein